MLRASRNAGRTRRMLVPSRLDHEFSVSSIGLLELMRHNFDQLYTTPLADVGK